MFGTKKPKKEEVTGWGQNREDILRKISKLETRLTQLELKVEQVSGRMGLNV